MFFQLKRPQNASYITRSATFRQLHHQNIAQKKEQSTAVTVLKTVFDEGFAKTLKVNERVGAVQIFFKCLCNSTISRTLGVLAKLHQSSKW